MGLLGLTCAGLIMVWGNLFAHDCRPAIQNALKAAIAHIRQDKPCLARYILPVNL